MIELYIAVDGDNVGSKLEHLTIMNDMATLEVFSEEFNSSMIWFKNQLVQNFDAKIIFYGGDNLLAVVHTESFSLEALEFLRSEFATKTGSTLSIGIGDVPRKAYLALKLAKTGGKNVIRYLQEA
jgi:GTP cyclohydrolase III